MSDEKGDYTRPVNFRKRYYMILKAAGIDQKGLHSLRHHFATQQINAVDVKTVSSMLGHYDAGFTLRTYTHATRQKQEQAAEKMGNFMDKVM